MDLASNPSHKLPVHEKVGYALGDAAANFVWRSSFFLPIFYTDTFGLTAQAAAILLLVVRLSDGVTDIIMGTVADRTNTRHGKFRPWVLWSAPVLGLFLMLIFTTPNLSDSGKLIYAYVIYFGLTLAYTANNVPYGALMGVMTPSVKERAELSAFRFVGSFGGGLLVLASMGKLVEYFGQGNDALGYQRTMIIFAVLLVVFCIITFKTTKERVQPAVNTHRSLGQELKDLCYNLPVILIPVLGVSAVMISLSQRDWGSEIKIGAAVFCFASFILTAAIRKRLIDKQDAALSPTQRDLKDLLRNSPWFILLLVGIMFGVFTVVRPSAAGFYFKYVLERNDLLGLYFAITLAASLLAAIAVGFLMKVVSKKVLFAAAFIGGGVFSTSMYFVPSDQVGVIMILAVIGEFFAGFMPVIFYSMLGDAADFSEWKNGRRATGLVYSTGTFINKTGHGLAGAIVMMVLAIYGYNAEVAETITSSLDGMTLLMTIIPTVFCIIGALLISVFPLTSAKMAKIESDLEVSRKSLAANA